MWILGVSGISATAAILVSDIRPDLEGLRACAVDGMMRRAFAVSVKRRHYWHI